jgi:dolichol-phosphate mannosyltransferase
MISVVTASYNEAENVPRLAERLRAALGGLEHELILVDDSSPDGTADVASRYFDRVIVMDHAGQTACLLEGIRSSRGDLVVTIDADLENPPELVPLMLQTAKAMGCDVLVASRTVLPRPLEIVASSTLGRLLGVSDLFSNFRVYRKPLLADYTLKLGETFGCELLAASRLRGARVCDVLYRPPPRRRNPRIGGALRANARAAMAWLKCMYFYLGLSAAKGLVYT